MSFSRFDAALFPQWRGAGALARLLSRQSDYALQSDADTPSTASSASSASTADSDSLQLAVGASHCAHAAFVLQQRRLLFVVDSVAAPHHPSRRVHEDALVRSLHSCAKLPLDDELLSRVLLHRASAPLCAVAFCGSLRASPLVALDDAGAVNVWLWNDSPSLSAWRHAVVDEPLRSTSVRVLAAAVVDAKRDAHTLVWLEVDDAAADVRFCSRLLRRRHVAASATAGRAARLRSSASDAAMLSAGSVSSTAPSSSSASSSSSPSSSSSSSDAGLFQKLDLADGRRLLGTAKNKASSLLGRMREGVTRLRQRNGAEDGGSESQAPTLVVDLNDADLLAEMAASAPSDSDASFSSAFADKSAPAVEFTADSSWRNAKLLDAGAGAWIVTGDANAPLFYWSAATGVVLAVPGAANAVFALDCDGALMQCDCASGALIRVTAVPECIAAAALTMPLPFGGSAGGVACFERVELCRLGDWQQPIGSDVQLVVHNVSVVLVDAQQGVARIFSSISGELRCTQKLTAPVARVEQINLPPLLLHGDGLFVARQLPPWPPASGALPSQAAEALLAAALECDAWSLEQLANHHLLAAVATAAAAHDSERALRAARLLAPQLSSPALLVCLLDSMPSARAFLQDQICGFLARVDGAVAPDIDSLSAEQRQRRIESAYHAATPVALQLKPLLEQYLSALVSDAAPTSAAETLWTLSPVALERMLQCEPQRALQLACASLGSLDDGLSDAAVARLCAADNSDELFHLEWLLRLCFHVRPDRLEAVCDAVAAHADQKTIAARFGTPQGVYVRASDALPVPSVAHQFSEAQTAARVALLRRCGRDVDALFVLLAQHNWSAATRLLSSVAASGDVALHERLFSLVLDAMLVSHATDQVHALVSTSSVVPASFDADALYARMSRHQTRPPQTALTTRGSGELAVGDVRDALIARVSDAKRAELLQQRVSKIEL
jgi:hypothetical protein